MRYLSVILLFIILFIHTSSTFKSPVVVCLTPEQAENYVQKDLNGNVHKYF